MIDDNEIPFPINPNGRRPEPDPTPADDDTEDEPLHSVRVTIAVNGRMMTTVEGPAVLVCAIPQMDAAGGSMNYLGCPSSEHAVFLLAAAISNVKERYGSTAVDRAIARARTTVIGEGIEIPRAAPVPSTNSLLDGPIGGGRL